jgi:hypothetical protein
MKNDDGRKPEGAPECSPKEPKVQPVSKAVLWHVDKTALALNRAATAIAPI